ncbi:MAG: hypothetical protein IJ874_09200 [Ruminococcus sp.]|nr:hypothetical protein [Ruminococcus sp.]
MPNNFTLISKYIALLDEVYKKYTLTGDLEADASTIRQGNNTHEILIPKMDMDGLADYDRKTGYADGSTSLEWQTKEFNYDRGRRFTVDAMDDEETAGLAFGKLSSEFIRTKVVPELDAWRFATYAGKAGTTKSEALTDGEGVCSAITAANNALDEAEVNEEGRILYITPTLHNAIIALDTYKSKAMLESFSKIVKVPKSRFYSAVSLLSGKKTSDTDDETIGGFKKASGGKNLNFMIVQSRSPLQYTKHAVNKIITPEANQTSDGWLFFYRAYGITDVYDNKKMGIYASVGTS